MTALDTGPGTPHSKSAANESSVARHTEKKELGWKFWNKRNSQYASFDAEVPETPASIESTAGTSIRDGQQPAQAKLLLERDIERLGRERPAAFKNAWTEIAFVFSISMSQVLAVRFDPLFFASIRLFSM